MEKESERDREARVLEQTYYGLLLFDKGGPFLKANLSKRYHGRLTLCWIYTHMTVIAYTAKDKITGLPHMWVSPYTLILALYTVIHFTRTVEELIKSKRQLPL